MHKRMLLTGAALLGMLFAMPALAEEAAAAVAAVNPFVGTFWSLVPPLVAIALALITKEVYSSLFCGIAVGALLYGQFNPVATVDAIVNDGLISAVTGTAGIFVFLVVLGAMTLLLNMSGGSAAFGRFAQKHIHSKVGAQICTFVLGVLIFIDDYFNCLTVGSVMRPVTDTHKVSRAKLAYLIDATAAPICMIAPISSWAAAVSDYTSGVTNAAGEPISSLALFCRAIPYNFYSLLTLVFIITLALMKFDYGPMALHERNAMEKGDLFTSGTEHASEDTGRTNDKGRVIDLLIPIVVLIVICVIGEGAGHGAYVVPIVRDMLDTYFKTDDTVQPETTQSENTMIP